MTNDDDMLIPPVVWKVIQSVIWSGIAAAIAGLIIIGVAWALLTFSGPAGATWKPEYASQPQEVQDWYRNAQLTEAAHARLGFANCCDHSDVVKTQFRVSKQTGHQDEWWYLNGNVWKQVPPDIIHWGEHAPGGDPVLFAYQGIETCFYPPDAGI